MLCGKSQLFFSVNYPYPYVGKSPIIYIYNGRDLSFRLLFWFSRFISKRPATMAAAAGDVEVVDFEPDDDDLMDEEVAAAEVDPSPAPRLRSAIAGSGSSGPRKTKGRGFREEAGRDSDSRLAARDFDSLDSDGGPGPQRCKFGNPNPMVPRPFLSDFLHFWLWIHTLFNFIFLLHCFLFY